MDNLRRKFTSATKPELPPPAEGRSVFHASLEALASAPPGGATEHHVMSHVDALRRFCGSGAEAAHHLAALLRGTSHADVADLFHERLVEVEAAAKVETAKVAAEVKAALGKVTQAPGSKESGGPPPRLTEEDIRLLSAVFTRLVHLHCHFLLTASEVLAPLLQQVNYDEASQALQAVPDDTQHHVAAAGQPSHLTQPNAGPAQHVTAPTPIATAPVAVEEGIVDGGGCELPEQDSTTPKSPASTECRPNSVATSSSGVAGSPSGLRKISSFFSKLGRSGSLNNESQTPQSSFYVSIGKEDGDESQEGNDKENCEDGTLSTGGAGRPGMEEAPPKETTLSAAMDELHLPPGAQDISQAMSGLPLNGRLATQEELDSVIDLLSGGQRSPMRVIPENVPSHHVSKVPIGPLYSNQLYSLSTEPPPAAAAPVAIDHAMYHQQHRRSDGLLGETLPREQKTNTWPHRPHMRSAAAVSTGMGGDMLGVAGSMTHPLASYDGMVPDGDYSRYLAAVKASKMGGACGVAGGSAHGGGLGGQGPWSAPDAGLNRSWPVHLFNQDGSGTEGANRNWSTVGDSSSCSDESSTGEAPWMMGIDLMGAVNDKRRHSSGDEGFPSISGGHVTDGRPRSVENLLDSKSTNTWPPKVPWAKMAAPGGPRGEGPTSGEGQPPVSSGGGPGNLVPGTQPHPPLTMQWSDPLTNRPLSAWGAGTIPSFSNQRLQSFPSLTQGGCIETLPPGDCHERPFPARK